MTLLDDAVTTATSLIESGVTSTLVMFDGEPRRTFVRPGLSTPTWETECAADVAGATRAVLIVPVVVDTEEFLHILDVDLDWGFDLYKCAIARGVDGQETVGETEHYTGQIQLHPLSPGYVLIQAMTAYREAPDEQAH